MKLEFRILLFFILTIFFLPAILGIFIQYIPLSKIPELGGSLKINGSIEVVQKFFFDKNNLSAIGLTIRNPSLVNKKDLIFKLEDEKRNLLREVRINGKVIDDGTLLKIKFAPLTDSMNKLYKFSLSSPESKSEESVEVYLAKDNSKGDWGVEVNSELTDGQIAFIGYSTPENRVMTSVNIYLEFFRKLISDQTFFVFYLVIFSILIGGIFYFGKKS